METNVYTKNQILTNLAQQGYFIDIYTLETFFRKWKIESIFEDDDGVEFFDKKALDFAIEKLCKQSVQDEEISQEDVKILSDKIEIQPKESQIVQEQTSKDSSSNFINVSIENKIQEDVQNKSSSSEDFQPFGIIQQQNELDDFEIGDKETVDLLSNITLSDGKKLIDSLNKKTDVINNNLNDLSDEEIIKTNISQENYNKISQAVEKINKTGILEGAMSICSSNLNKDNQDMKSLSEFDDMSLLTEQIEAQEKFKEYVSSISQQEPVLAEDSNSSTKNNEFKLDISERTINMIARTMAKKISKQVISMCSSEFAKLNGADSSETKRISDQNKRLILKTKELEEQNKKLRLLLAQSNKNLNSYKPTFFGLYQKIVPKKKS